MARLATSMLLLLLAATPIARSSDGRGAAGLQLWVEPVDRAEGALQSAVDQVAAAAAVASAGGVDGRAPAATIHLAPGTHLLSRPLVLDARHAGTRFVGHGGASVSGAVRIGGPPPRDGGRNTSGWVVVGKANCSGCSEIWRAASPKGVDSRQDIAAAGEIDCHFDDTPSVIY